MFHFNRANNFEGVPSWKVDRVYNYLLDIFNTTKYTDRQNKKHMRAVAT